MMEMNDKKQYQTPVQMVTIPAPILTQLFFDVHYLADMHQNLICMYERESALKKHHKAYLHVREEADEMCSQDKIRVKTILDHYENPDKHFEKAIQFHDALMQQDDPFRKRGKHEKKEEERPAASIILVPLMDEEDCEDCPHKEECKIHETPEVKEEKKLDAFALPDGMVMMSTGTLGVMQDDMLALTMVVDHLVQVFKDIDEGGGYDRYAAHKLVGEAVGLSQDVFKRWDEADLAELN